MRNPLSASGVRVFMKGMLIAAALAIVPLAACQAASSEAGPQKMRRNEVAPSDVALGRTPVRVRIGPSRGPSIGSRVDALRPGRRLYLVLRGFRTEEPPSTVYHVYLDLPAGAKPAEDDPRYVGTINFYESYGGGNTDDKFRSFDVTDVARSLRARGFLKDGTTITILPGTDPGEGAKARISRIELVEQ